MTWKEEKGGTPGLCPRAMEVPVPGWGWSGLKPRAQRPEAEGADRARTARRRNGFRRERRAGDRNWERKCSAVDGALRPQPAKSEPVGCGGRGGGASADLG